MADELYLKVDGIPGESKDERHKDEIDVLSYSWGETLPATAADAGGGGARVVIEEVRFVMRVNRASPKLFLACASATHISTAVLTLRRAGGAGVEFLKWTLSVVAVTSYQTASNVPPGDRSTDQVSFRFGKIEMEYRPMNPDGSLGPPITAGWDAAMSRPM